MAIKFSPALAGYLAVGVATSIAAYFILKYLGLNFGRVGEMADAAAEDYGQTKALAETGPGVLYAQARSDYAKFKGIHFTQLTNWPSRTDWLEGDGPLGYTYGSPAYPEPQEPGIWTSITSVF